MRVQVSVLACRLLIATGTDTDQTGDPPDVVSNINGQYEIAPEPEPDVTPEDFGFQGRTPA